MNKKKVVIWLIVFSAAVIAFFPLKSYIELKTYQKQVSDIKITDVDLSKIPDGTYKGSYEVIWVAAEVKVTVKDHKIADIELVKHKNGKGKPAEVIPGKVVEAQSLEVDIVSGCTSSSKVILKAIENALNSANMY